MVKKYTYLEPFLQTPKKTYSLQELEEFFATPHQTIKKQVTKLVEENILIEDKRKRFLFYTINLENPLTLDAISITEKIRLQKRLQEEPLLQQLYEELSPFFNNTNILLFGSATTTKFNDIDLIIIGKNKEIKKKILLFEQTFNKPIEALYTNFRNISETLHKEIIKKHIIFNNHDYFTKHLYSKNSTVQ